MEYSIGELIDQLTILNIKIFNLIDRIEAATDEENISKEAKKVQELNKQRSVVRNRINELLGDSKIEIKI